MVKHLRAGPHLRASFRKIKNQTKKSKYQSLTLLRTATAALLILSEKSKISKIKENQNVEIEGIINTVYNGDCVEGMATLPPECIDLTVTSPPYDRLRKYNGFAFDFENTALQLYRVTKKGGVVVWVVGDSTKNGSETGTSFKQALFFKACGFNLYDTMIYRKQNYVPLTHRRYEQEFEYMFVLSKGMPKTFNPIKVPCKYAGTTTWGKATFHKTSDSGLVDCGVKKINDFKQHGNIFTYLTGKDKQNHPAPFPLQLAIDQILTWSNEGEIVMDTFMGSGTTAKAAIETNRQYIGYEISKEYCEMIQNRLKK